MIWFIIAMSVIGTVANAFHKRWGFSVWIVGNVFWIFHYLNLTDYAQVVLGFIYLASSIYGFVTWPKEDRKKIEKP